MQELVVLADRPVKGVSENVGGLASRGHALQIGKVGTLDHRPILSGATRLRRAEEVERSAFS
jgi:hypothetical protein